MWRVLRHVWVDGPTAHAAIMFVQGVLNSREVAILMGAECYSFADHEAPVAEGEMCDC
jgi:hypothetical protein